VVAGLLVLWLVYAVQSWAVSGRPRWEIAVAFGVLAAAAGSALRWGSRLEQIRRGGFAVVAAASIVAPRLAWILIARPLQASDFRIFDLAGHQLAAGQPHLAFPPNLGIVLQLATIYRLFGPSQLTAQVVNVLLALPTALLLYRLARRLAGEAAARLAVVLFALWPCDIMFRGVFATEFGFAIGLLGGLDALVSSLGSRRPWRGALVAGVAFGIADAFRPVGPLVVAAAVVWLLLRLAGTRRRRLAAVAVLVASFAAVVAGSAALRTLTGFHRPAISPLTYLLFGTSIEGRGQWNQADHELFDRLWAEAGGSTPRAAGLVAGVVWRRVVDHPRAMLGLAFTKIAGQWADDTFGAYWGTLGRIRAGHAAGIEVALPVLSALSQYAWIGLLAAALAGCLRPRAAVFGRDVGLLLVVLLVFVLLHLVIEVQGRYHEPWAFVVLVLAGRGLAFPPRSSSGQALAVREPPVEAVGARVVGGATMRTGVETDPADCGGG